MVHKAAERLGVGLEAVIRAVVAVGDPKNVGGFDSFPCFVFWGRERG